MTTEFSIRQAVWPDDSELMRELRTKVFVLEQGVDKNIEWDGRDHLCQHVIAYSTASEPVGTGRILPSGHIGRIAVLPSWRGKGVGSAILESLISIARNTDADKVYLNSQVRAINFYRRYDFIAEGPVFMEAGIPHQRMNLFFNDKGD